jgi:hypothetical protein
VTTCRLPFASKCYASDVAFVARGLRGAALLKRVKRVGGGARAPVMFANGYGDERVDQLYQAVGLKRVGGIYMG